jgi:hypothetical protein
MPIGNRLVDPQFDLVGGVGWYTYTGTAETASGVLSRVFFARTPMQQPALKMSKGSTTTAYAVLGMFSGSSAPMQVSVWLGRQQRDDDSTIKYVAASVLGFFAEADAAMSLHMDTTTAPVLLDGMRWQRFVATLVPAPIGPAFLYVEDGAASDLYMSSPIAIDIESNSTFMAGGAPVLGCETRALSTSERSGLDAVKHALQRFTHAPTPQPTAAWPQRKRWGHPDTANNQLPK